MTLKYCGGNSLMAEAVFGWGRQTVARGLGERRTGIICLGAPAAFSGRKRWEEQHPHVAQALRELAASPCATRPDIPHLLGLHQADGPSGIEGAQRSGL